jgi:hypothetical protein
VSNEKATEDLVPGLPLVIGVTGHRDLREGDREALETSVRNIFDGFRKSYPNAPLVLLSPLAEGADRLVAEVALSCDSSLIVPLPMPQALYETDFETPESKAEFHSLLQRAEAVYTLAPIGDYSADEIRERGPSRARQYAQVGAYIARHSHILIALWDKVPSEKVGGTAQIVRFRLEGVPELYVPRQSPLDLVASGPLYHVVTPRKSSSKPEGTPGKLRKLFPKGYENDAAAEEAYHLIFLRTDTFNRDSRRLDSKLAGERESSKHYLFTDDRRALPAFLKRIMDYYAAADSLARHFQSWTLRALRALFLLVFVGVCFFQAYSDLKALARFLVVYTVILGVAYLYYALARKKEFHGKYLDYRALAEGMRVQFFWQLAGLNKSVADHYLRKQRSELDWIRKAIRVWTMSTEFQHEPPASPATIQNRLRLVLSEWVKRQRLFYAGAVERDKRKLRWQKRMVRLFFLISIVLTVIQIFWGENVPVLVFSMGLALVIAGLLAGYGERRALAEQIKQYAQMGTIFANAEQRLSELLEAGEQAQALDLIEELGKEALGENGDWVILHRERAVEVPTPG